MYLIGHNPLKHLWQLIENKDSHNSGLYHSCIRSSVCPSHIFGQTAHEIGQEFDAYIHYETRLNFGNTPLRSRRFFTSDCSSSSFPAFGNKPLRGLSLIVVGEHIVGSPGLFNSLPRSNKFPPLPKPPNGDCSELILMGGLIIGFDSYGLASFCSYSAEFSPFRGLGFVELFPCIAGKLFWVT